MTGTAPFRADTQQGSKAMSILSFKRRGTAASQSGQVARRSRAQAAAQAGTPARARGGWSSMIRLAPLGGDSPAKGWAEAALARLGRPAPAAPVFLCTDFAPSQWWVQP